MTVLDVNSTRLAYLDDIFGSRLTGLYSTESNIEEVLTQADILIGAVLVDVAIDQGGVSESSKPTVAPTSVTLSYGLAIADSGLEAAAAADPALRKGLNCWNGACVHPGVARSCGLPYTEPILKR